MSTKHSRSKPALPLTTDAGNAELFASLYGDRVRYDHRQGRWLIWDKCWTEDSQNMVRNLAIKAARYRLRASSAISDEDKRKSQARWGLVSENRQRLEAALELAKSLSPISDSGERWDANPWLLGVQNGVVDLRTGKLRAEQKEDYITKHSPVRFDPKAKCPRFQRFLDEVFLGNSELIGYIQRALGYTLTGSVEEQCLFCNYGEGANGKSTFLEVIHHILGYEAYAENLPFSALDFKDRNNNDLTKLQGRRFVTSVETNEGVRLNEGRIKSITGGDRITARRLYHEAFTFQPTHKLWLAFNHRPVIADDSEGMWRRVQLIPWLRVFDPAARDKNLLGKLKKEASGILAFMVRGCVAWRHQGLKPPKVVLEATANYRAESDHLGQFIDECCLRDEGATVLTAELWQAYVKWANENEEVTLSRQTFTNRLKSKGFTPGRTGHEGKRTWKGLGLIADTPTRADSVSDKIPQEEQIRKIYKKPVSVRQRVSVFHPPITANAHERSVLDVWPVGEEISVGEALAQ